MARYDGLIIPRSYNDYISKSDAATLAQALQLGGVLSSELIKNDPKAIKGGAVYDAITLINHRIGRGNVSNTYLGKDITQYFTDGSIWNRLNGTGGYRYLEDIFVGDYFQMSRAIVSPFPVSESNNPGSQWATIADIDILYSRGNENVIGKHHLICIPGNGELNNSYVVFGTGIMYENAQAYITDDTADAGGYKASFMNTQIIGAPATSGSTAAGATINQQLYAEFGEHLTTVNELISNKVTSTLVNNRCAGLGNGAASGASWENVQAILMSENELYGAPVWSSSGFDCGTILRQLAVFNLSERTQHQRNSRTWLRDVANATSFCTQQYRGNADIASANNNYSIGIRPRWVLA